MRLIRLVNQDFRVISVFLYIVNGDICEDGEDEVDEAMLTFALVALTRSQCCSTFAHTVTPRSN